MALVDSTNLNPRIELASGGYVKVTLTSTAQNDTAGSGLIIGLGIDGSEQSLRQQYGNTGYAAGMSIPVAYSRTLPLAGSKKIGPMWQSITAATTALLFASGNYGLDYTIEEIVRENAQNNSLTTG
jgi:hypothetical protein